jgi:hypothetical protein
MQWLFSCIKDGGGEFPNSPFQTICCGEFGE